MPILVLQSLMKILTNVQWKYFNRKDAWDHSQNNLSEPWHNIQVNLVIIIITITLILILIAYILIGFYNSKWDAAYYTKKKKKKKEKKKKKVKQTNKQNFWIHDDLVDFQTIFTNNTCFIHCPCFTELLQQSNLQICSLCFQLPSQKGSHTVLLVKEDILGHVSSPCIL